MSNILLDTLNKQPLICAEGYLFEMERRGYLTSGEFVHGESFGTSSSFRKSS